MSEQHIEYLDEAGNVYRQWARFTVQVLNDEAKVIGCIELDSTNEEWDQYSHELALAATALTEGEVEWTTWDEDGVQMDVVVVATGA